MNWIDLFSLVILFLFFVAGFVKGLVREVLTLIGVVVSFFVALHLMGAAAVWMDKWLSLSGRASVIAGFVLVFVALLVLFHLIAYVAWRAVRASPLSFGDRLAGAVFGLFKAGLAIFLVLLVVSLVPFKGRAPKHLEESLAYRSVRWATPSLTRYLRRASPGFLRALGREKEGRSPSLDSPAAHLRAADHLTLPPAAGIFPPSRS